MILLVTLLVLIRIPPVQTWLVKQAASYFSEQIGAKVSIKSVNIGFFNKMVMEGLLVEDLSHDTLLYAGNAKVNINDWFFVKDKITLKYFSLDDAVVNLNRKDSVWNYNFIVDYFDTPKSKNPKKKKMDFDLKELHISNLRFVQQDDWVGQGMSVQLNKLKVLVDEVNIPNKKVVIREIAIDKPQFSQSDFNGNRPANSQKKLSDLLRNQPYQWNAGGWDLMLLELIITDGSFKNDKQTIRDTYADQFDGQHIHFKDIVGRIDSLQIKGDTIKGHVRISTKEKSGLNIEQLDAQLRLTPEIFEFDKLLLKTDKSTLGNYYAMSYSNFKKDMSNFITNVAMNAKFENSTLNTDDLAIFAPALKTWKKKFQIKGDFQGTVDNFSARDVALTSGLTGFNGNIALRGLPNVQTTFIDVEAKNLSTHYADIVQFVPALKKVTTPQIKKLGTVKYKGNFTGFWNDFVAYGTIQTNLGIVQADLNMKLPTDRPPEYYGKLSANNFNIGSFLNVNKLGNITFNGNVAGTGFSVNTLNVNFDGIIPRIQYANQTYHNLNVTGDFDPQFFVGHLSIDDPKLKIPALDGTIRLEGSDMEINADANLEYADLKSLGISNTNMYLKGLFSVNFTGSNIDNFLGYAKVSDATLIHEEKRLSFDSLTLTSLIEDDQKVLRLQSNEVDAALVGKFNIMDLPNSFKFFLSRYYPNYIEKPKYAVSDQDFEFSIFTKSVDEYVRLFDSRLKGFDNATIEGKLDIINSDLDLNMYVPEFSYQNNHFNNLELKAEGNTEHVSFNIDAGNIIISDSLQFPKTNIKISSSNDLSFISVQTSAYKTLNSAELNASVQTLKDGVKIKFFPSAFILNDKRWVLERDGELTLRKQFIDVKEIKFVHKDQQIIIDSELSDETDQTHLVAKLVNVKIEDFTPLFLKNPKLAGSLTGTAYLHNLYGNREYNFEGTADSFAMNDKYVGKVKLDALMNENDGELKFNVAAEEPGYVFTASGEMNLKDSTRNMAIQLDGEEVNLAILQPFLNTIFGDIQGIAKTNLKISGPPERMKIIGDAYIDSASFLIAYTQCRYITTKHTIRFNEDEIDLGRMQLRDTLRNTGTLTGKIHHEFFDKLSFNNLKFETSKMLLLNTTSKDNQQFYGYVIGYANMGISGPLTNMIMDIRGQPSATDTSHIFLPIGATTVESASVDYIEFVKFGELMETPRYANETNILVLLDIDATSSCKVDVILDEETGDVLKAQGDGKISIRVGNTEPLSIRGRYVLAKGEYNFNFQTFFQIPFALREGGSISWNGDPYMAVIDIDAEYVAKNVDVSVLATAGGYRQKEDVTIIAHLTGMLQKPNIDFDIVLPEKSEIKNDYIAVKKLADFKTDQAEMYKQVASLLLFNTFISGTQSFLTAENSVSFVTSTIGGIMSDLLTRMLNKELERATKGVLSTYVDINPTINLQTAANQLQANVRAGLKLLLSKRLFMLVGGNLEYNNPATLQLAKRGLITPDITIEWLLNKDGSLRVVGFNRTSIDLTIGQRNRSGVQFSYRKDFNRISDIFKSKKKIDALIRERRSPTKVVELR